MARICSQGLPGPCARCDHHTLTRGRRDAMILVEMLMLLMFFGACGGIIYFLVNMLK